MYSPLYQYGAVRAIFILTSLQSLTLFHNHAPYDAAAAADGHGGAQHGAACQSRCAQPAAAAAGAAAAHTEVVLH